MVLACIRKSSQPLIAFCLVFSVEAFDSLMRISRHFYPFINSQGLLNWQGGILSILWPLVIIFVFKWLSPEEAGLKVSHTKKSLFLGLVFGVILGGWNFLDEYLRGTLGSFGETTLYMLIIPGLSEEIVSRGLLLAILIRYLGQPWNLYGIRFGWGIILVSLLFIEGHLFIYSLSMNHFIWTGSIDLIGNVIVATITFAYLRLKTRSIWPGVICHSMIDVAPFLGFG